MILETGSRCSHRFTATLGDRVSVMIVCAFLQLSWERCLMCECIIPDTTSQLALKPQRRTKKNVVRLLTCLVWFGVGDVLTKLARQG
jgi:hypothetical protein